MDVGPPDQSESHQPSELRGNAEEKTDGSTASWNRVTAKSNKQETGPGMKKENEKIIKKNKGEEEVQHKGKNKTRLWSLTTI